jgi:putative addiction module CopG family antidote
MIQITLTPEQERFLQTQLNSGKYRNPEQVITEAFKLLEEQETPLLPPQIKGSESAKKLLAEKVKQYREKRENQKNQPIDSERKKLSQELRDLFDITHAIPGLQDITEEEIAAEIEAYRRGE